METDYLIILLVISGVLLLVMLFTTVRQGTIAVVTVFGKFQRIMRPGLNIRVPLIEKIHSRVSIQNQSQELAFQATTSSLNFDASDNRDAL